MKPATSIGQRRTRKDLLSSTISSAPLACYLYGRKVFQTMAIWETPDVMPPDVVPGGTPAMLDFARTWQAADKIVYSKSLETVSTPKTRLEREFDPQAVRDLKAQLPHDVSVGGPTLAAHAIRTGLVDEIHLFVVPIVIGAASGSCPATSAPPLSAAGWWPVTVSCGMLSAVGCWVRFSAPRRGPAPRHS